MKTRIRAMPVALLALGLAAASAAGAVDWSQVPEQQVMLFYPGQASWEWALTESSHSGAPKFREGKNCRGCHDGEQADIGAAIVAGGKLEPHPVPGKAGSLPLTVQVASEDNRLLLRLRWTAGEDAAPPMDPEVAARVTVMVGDASVKEAMRAGCWGSCHDDVRGMASAAPDGELTKYLAGSRTKVTRQGGGTNFKPDAELQALLDQGAYLEYWQARLNPGQPAEASSGRVLARRDRHPEPVHTVQAGFANGQWTVEMARPLRPAGAGLKQLQPGSTYALGFAVHDDHADHRHHYVSFEYTMVLGDGEADFVAR